ncbi:hypothetical protein SIAM614_05643 [Stappia aggregata IAM 12614]|uniref:DUF805 domain-containing protein n=1 Tax=Roseibium aggregatum (strain ATCC 25650 / DSM 13394 / JCM 20685 / NBRC 16684 / NCIMB 2208 / IAM 12614 / B1) TaxID=384765 RepID=A0NUX4_ROSAI|nr:DUF805 domain-containing protein [Roseibium aggregatum]EAV43241.1 hypothetical protein SIAM614_05643 [Stappia aggregata IAM 12614] [Roseibium aggregatum IAM 12614]
MPAQRKQFGRRGLDRQVPSQWGPNQSSYSSNDGYAATAGAYARAGGAAIQVAGDSGGSLIDAVMQCLGLFFSFKGRTGRLGYWGIGTFNLVMMMAVLFAYLTAIQDELQNYANSDELLASGSVLTMWLLILPFFVSNLAVQVRRFHDRDVSGYWLLVWFIPIVGSFFALVQGFANMFFSGTPGPNQYDTPQSQAHIFD